MRPLLLAVICLLALGLASCKKSSSSGNTNPPPPPPGNGGGTGKVTITGIAPLIAYQGDVITITGTGFDLDKFKDTVLIGIVDNSQNRFMPRGLSNPFYPNPVGNIISATATEIKFRTDSTVLFTEGLHALFAVQVSAPSGSHYTPDTLFIKNLPSIISVTSTDPYPKAVCDAYRVFAGDSVYIAGRGLYPPLTITIDGKPLDYQRFVQNGDYNLLQTATGFIGIDYFGTKTPPADGHCTVNNDFNKIIKVVNGDGRTAILSTPFLAGPNSKIIDAHMSQTVYYRSKDNSALLTIDGYAIRNFSIQITGTDPATQQPFKEDLGSFDGDLVGPYTTQVDFGALPKPDAGGTEFQVVVKDGNGNRFGGSVFTLFP